MDTEIAEPRSANAEAPWDEAFVRTESYLRAYGLESAVLLNELTAAIIQEARQKAQETPSAEPVALALETAHARIGAWFVRSGGQCDWANDSSRLQGRLALIVADLPGRWANAFLSPDPLPAALAEAMSSFQILPSPEVRLANMAPEPLEFALIEPLDRRLPGRRFWKPARAAVSWLLIFGFFGIAWAESH